MSSTPQFVRETDASGAWRRQSSAFRSWVEDPKPGRYHLYVSLACPWAHRTVIVRRLKGLERVIGMTIVDPLRDERGWRFGDDTPERGERDHLHGWTYLGEAYRATDPSFDARVTVPLLWDTVTGRALNNESGDIIRMLNGAFDDHAEHPEVDLYPEHLRAVIDETNDWVYSTINNGVYRCGFAATQEAYDEAFEALFESLDRVEQILSTSRYLTGDVITEADWRLFTTLVRFDAVYVGHFKCNLRRLVDYPNLWSYARELYQVDGVADTVNFDHIKRHYYITHDRINPTGIVPGGPAMDWLKPHARS